MNMTEPVQMSNATTDLNPSDEHTSIGWRAPLARHVRDSIWLECGTSSSAAVPDELLAQQLTSGALIEGYRTTSGSQRVQESPEPQRLILELRRKSGLTWSELAGLFRVDRRTLHFWARGASPTRRNAQRLRNVVQVVRLLDQGDPNATKRALSTPDSRGRTVLGLMASQRFSAARTFVTTGSEEKGLRADLQRKRPPRLSATVRRQRRAFDPDELLGAVASDEYDNGRYLASFSLTLS